MAANGGVTSDVRRVLLAQGLVLGVGSSLVGVGLGLLAFRALAPSWEQLFGQVLWRQELDWFAVVLIAVLGSLTSLVAALLPAWSIGRLTPVAALSGRFPIRPGEALAHRGAFVLLGSGLTLLALGGWLTSRTFGPDGQEVTLAPALAALGLVLTVAGAVWATPYVVRRAAEVGRALPLSGRYAFRDAGRHRFRSAASVVALMITVAGAVLVGFASTSAAATTSWGPAPRTMEVFTDVGPRRGASPEQLARMEATVEGVMGPVDTLSSYGLRVAGQRRSYVRIPGLDGELQVTDEATLASLTDADTAVLDAFDDGSMVVVGREATGFPESARLRARSGRESASETWTLPASTSSAPAPNGDMPTAFISEETAERLGLEPTYGQVYFTAERAFTDEDLDRLAVYGIEGYSSDPDRALADRMQLAGLAVAAALCALVVGVAVALSAAESRDEMATLAAVGAGPWHRRRFGAMHGLFLGLAGAALGVASGVPAGLALSQVDGLAGVDLPWLTTAGTVLVVLVAAPLAGWVVTPSRLRLDRRTA
jgi:putative ABC transport system permease protein